MPDDGFSIGVEGLAELQVTLDRLGKDAADRAIRKALRAGAAVEQAAIVERAPVNVIGGGTLPAYALKSDVTVRFFKDALGAISAIVGPGKLTAHVARWVEYGHRMITGGRSRLLANGKTVGPGSQVGTVPAHPYIRPAYESSRQEVVNVICTTLATEVEKAAVRNGVGS